MHICIYIYIYIYTHMYVVCVCICLWVCVPEPSSLTANPCGSLHSDSWWCSTQPLDTAELCKTRLYYVILCPKYSAFLPCILPACGATAVSQSLPQGAVLGGVVSWQRLGRIDKAWPALLGTVFVSRTVSGGLEEASGAPWYETLRQCLHSASSGPHSKREASELELLVAGTHECFLRDGEGMMGLVNFPPRVDRDLLLGWFCYICCRVCAALAWFGILGDFRHWMFVFITGTCGA